MSLRIAILASNYIKLPPSPEDIPPGDSGAPEKIMSVIAEELVKRGHEVTLFASGDSKTAASLVSVTDHATGLDPNIKQGKHIEYEHLLISKCFEMAKEGRFDIIHSIFDTRSAYYAPLVSTPVVSTLHSPLDEIRVDILSHFKRSQYFVSISNAQRVPLLDLQYAQTIYHGIDILALNFSENPKSENMLFVGRIVPEKGVAEGIAVAQKLNLKIDLLGSANEEGDFWKETIKPQVDGSLIKYHGHKSGTDIIDFYQNAKVFLFPIQWEEPFGLVMVEAMACGTPVIAFARGSVPEIVKDGVTGFIVNSSEKDKRGDWIIKKTGIDGLQEAVEKIYAMSSDEYLQMRKNCRRHVEENFTVGKMVDGYENVYKKILENPKQS